MKERRVDACQELLKRFEAEGDGFLGRTVREMKPGSTTTSRKKRARKGAIPPHQHQKKIRTQPSAGKVMLTLFWDKRGVIFEHYMPRGNPVTSTTYTDLLKNHLRPAINSKRRGLLSTGILLQCDKAWSHTAHSTVATIQDCPLSVFHILRTRQTSTPVTFTSLDHSKRQWDTSLSGLTKRCTRGARAAALSTKRIFF
jgi:hypothetical protein